MKKHEFFEIWLHDNAELSDLCDKSIVVRESLQAWPLSVVERISFEDKTSWIYKVYRNLPIETHFYQNVNSSHVPKLFFSVSDGDQHWLFLEDIAGEHVVRDEKDSILTLAQQIRNVINEIDFNKSFRYDLSKSNYGIFCEELISLLKMLHKEKKLAIIDKDIISQIEKALFCPAALQTVQGHCALLHGDLKCDNILVRPDGTIVIIDWQNFLWGPEKIDIYSLMANQFIDPVPIAGVGPEILRLALIIKWYADCLDRWLPYTEFYSQLIMKIAKQMCHIIDNDGYAGMESLYFT